MLYRDREDAGRRLAPLLEKYRNDEPLVLALPRGGVVVGYEVAEYLDAPLDVQVVRKLGAPQQPELGFGAIASGGVRVIKEETVRLLRLSPEQIDEVTRAEQGELQRREKLYRADRPRPPVQGRTVILVDDGLATGGTARAAVEAMRHEKPLQVVVAVPVAPPAAAVAFEGLADDFVCPEVPADFHAIGQFYADFSQTTDQEVISLLEANHRRQQKEE